jgi:2-hydroxy-3-oxopropionate reductase
MTTVAILGTGKMGGAMARRLVGSDFDVTLWNRTSDKADALHLGRVAATPEDAARDADVIISSLTNEAAIRDVYLGEHGVLRSAAGKLLIEIARRRRRAPICSRRRWSAASPRWRAASC